jgi:outer membrane protein TolC
MEAASRELADAATQPSPVVTSREDGTSRLNIRPDIMEELDRMAGPRSYEGSAPDLGPDLLGLPARTYRVSLERAVRGAVENNNAVQFARISPAIQQAQLLAAEAAFDWTLFSNLNWANTDSPRVSTGTGSIATTANSDVSQALSGAIGLRRQLVGGGRFLLQHDLSYTDNATPGQVTEPNPANQVSITAQWDQPLLRNFGTEVGRAQVRITRNAERNAVQTLKRDLIRTVTDAERTYWRLVRARREVSITQRLLERGERTRDQVKERALVDANNAQIADATARVERRRADVLRAQTQLRLVSDELKALMNDPDLPVGSEVVLLPADDAPDAPVAFSLLESLRTCIQQRPEVQQSILAIDDATIRQTVADSLRLPDLSLRLQTRFAAVERELPGAYDDLGGFIDYLVGLAFEMPIGNRAAEAGFRQRWLERMQSVLSYRNTLQQVTNETKGALNRVSLNYPLISQTRASRIAASEVLRVADVEKKEGFGYTADALFRELSNQESLAATEQGEAEAITEYNIALADLFAAMGTTLERNNIEFVVPAAPTDDILVPE